MVFLQQRSESMSQRRQNSLSNQRGIYNLTKNELRLNFHFCLWNVLKKNLPNADITLVGNISVWCRRKYNVRGKLASNVDVVTQVIFTYYLPGHSSQ